MTGITRAQLYLAPVIIGVLALSAFTVHTNDRGSVEAAALSDSATVAATVDGFYQAIATGDSTGALARLATDVVILESGGAETRSEYRSHHLAGDIEFAKALKSVRAPLQITIDGNTAWTTGTSTTQGEFNGRKINSAGAESMVLTRSKNGWQIRSIHWSSRTRRPPA